ncbi:MAG TPA: hypothetical protein VEL76_07425 [Gemmataceae bacterium]|nr:hypothetical protein [Gemmataceae bacterium]
MRLTLIVALAIVLGQGSGLAVQAQQPARHVETAGGFSFVPPKGWKATDEAIANQVKQIEKQLAAAPPGSPQEKALKRAIATLQLMAKQSMKGFLGSGADGPAPTISFSVEDLRKFNITVNGVAVKATLADLVAHYKYPPPGRTNEEVDSFRVVAEKKLKTDAGAECVVLVTEFDRNRLRYRQTYYFFDLSPDRKLVATCKAPWIDKLDAVFEASLKTLRLEKPRPEKAK